MSRTNIVYGHEQHLHHAKRAVESGVISKDELRTLIEYSDRIFSGQRMSIVLSNQGDEINQRIHYMVQGD